MQHHPKNWDVILEHWISKGVPGDIPRRPRKSQINMCGAIIKIGFLVTCLYMYLLVFV